MTLPIVQLGTEGFKITVNVKDSEGETKDLTGATNLKIKARSALATTGKTFDAALEGSGDDGAVSYTVETDDIDVIGVWSAQAYYELSGFKGHTEVVEAFEVMENLA